LLAWNPAERLDRDVPRLGATVNGEDTNVNRPAAIRFDDSCGVASIEAVFARCGVAILA